MPAFDWSVINTALLIGAIGYLWRQAKLVDQVRQALLGFEGHGGIIVEVKLLRERSHELANTMSVLSGQVEQLTEAIEERRQRRTT